LTTAEPAKSTQVRGPSPEYNSFRGNKGGDKTKPEKKITYQSEYKGPSSKARNDTTCWQSSTFWKPSHGTGKWGRVGNPNTSTKQKTTKKPTA
jgi:hypothetical protein